MTSYFVTADEIYSELQRLWDDIPRSMEEVPEGPDSLRWNDGFYPRDYVLSRRAWMNFDREMRRHIRDFCMAATGFPWGHAGSPPWTGMEVEA